jgi:hypothetical protein
MKIGLQKKGSGAGDMGKDNFQNFGDFDLMIYFGVVNRNWGIIYYN